MVSWVPLSPPRSLPLPLLVAAPYGLAALTGVALQATVLASGCHPYELATVDCLLCRGPWLQQVAPL
ncbi:hypothetical protein B296_00001946 [Ensete ventricosum]|uniref:Uncharacterized protein n=1 Tax=Ensete ventricosum TaxID=4639 RepID=A0A426Y9E3_ENSVE|nr:hypothetical protein B296_00001946 [Ensete ventricosum]